MAEMTWLASVLALGLLQLHRLASVFLAFISVFHKLAF